VQYKTIRETRILADDEVIDISVTQVPISSEVPHGVKYSFNYRIRMSEGWRTLIRFDNAHIIKGHHKRDHWHMFENEVQEIEFKSPKELLQELMRLIENNRRKIDEIKRR
jgi:predicted metallo-beta-lactamase superfamily hydrolase